MPNNKKYVELLWYQKYDKLDLGDRKFRPFVDN